jgi:N6-L-threonylcarbamoyladenine synthase
MGNALTRPVLGLESSCDETAAAILAPDGTILAETVLSQEREHVAFGGVVPEIAARAHLAYLPGRIQAVLADAGLGFTDLGAVAASAGPGLIGGLIVGSQMAKGIALARGIPYVAVNHLEAHALTPRLPGLGGDGAPFPYVLLLLSGGHCQCVLVRGVGVYERLGGTIDDAVGEAFDKVAKLLGLGWPGGPALERLAQEGDKTRFKFPRPLLGRSGCDFSFSGLKTAVAQTVAKQPTGALRRNEAADLAAGFQAAVTDVLADRAANALELAAERCGHPIAALVVSGGVAANQAVRSALIHIAERVNARLIAPPIRLCTDNAVMVAWAAIERLRLGGRDGLDFAPRPRWGLETMAPPGGSA